MSGQLGAAVLGCSLDRLGLRQRGVARVLPAGPGHRARSLLCAPVITETGRPDTVVLKYALSPTPAEEQELAWEHRVTAVLHAAARRPNARSRLAHNPVPEPMIEQPLSFSVGKLPVVVSARRFVECTPQPLTARSLGRLIAGLHALGASPRALALLGDRHADPLHGLDPERLARTLAARVHPFHSRPEVSKALIQALESRVKKSLSADPRPLLVHRDLHPLNAVAAPAGPVALDWAEAGWGSRSDDFAWLYLAVARHGAAPRVLAEALAGYEEVSPGGAPTADQVRAAGQVKEVVCLAFSLMNAHRSRAHLREAHRELPILHDPDAVTARWRALYNPQIFRHPLFSEATENSAAGTLRAWKAS